MSSNSAMLKRRPALMRSGGTGGATSKTNEAVDLLRTPGAIQLVRAYNKIKARGMRTSVVDLVERIADVSK